MDYGGTFSQLQTNWIHPPGMFRSTCNANHTYKPQNRNRILPGYPGMKNHYTNQQNTRATRSKHKYPPLPMPAHRTTDMSAIHHHTPIYDNYLIH